MFRSLGKEQQLTISSAPWKAVNKYTYLEQVVTAAACIESDVTENNNEV